MLKSAATEIHYAFHGLELSLLEKKKSTFFLRGLPTALSHRSLRVSLPLKLALFLCKKANKTYFFLDGSEGKSTPAGKATGEDPARSGLLLRRLRRCPRKATSRSGHLFSKNTIVLKTK